MTFQEFEEWYGVPTDNVYVVMNKNNPEWITKSAEGNLIDEKYLVDLAKHRKKLWLASHDYYYYFTYVVGWTQSQLAKAVTKRSSRSKDVWMSFIACSMFKPVEFTLLTEHISSMLIEFVEYCETLIPIVHKIMWRDEGYLERLKDMS